MKLNEVFRYFFRLGFIAFGGPAAHIAMMQQDLVEKKKWLSSQNFLDYMGVTNLIPGPNSTEMTMHCGYHRSGVAGVFVAGISFILPAASLTLLIAIFYEQYKELSWLVPIITGIKASVISLILAAVYKLGKKAVKSYYLLGIGLVVLAASLLGLNEILCILFAGLFAIAVHFSKKSSSLNSFLGIPLMAIATVFFSQTKLFLVFLKVGLVLFGSGYVLFAYLEGELIDNLGWLTHSDLIEAIAIGQVTPGPILSTATFIGYKLGGIQGALLATLGIFAPSFFYVIILHRFLDKMKKSAVLKVFLESVNVAAVAVMVAVTISMGQSIIVDWQTLSIAVLTCALYLGTNKMNSLYIILLGGILGYLLLFVFG